MTGKMTVCGFPVEYDPSLPDDCFVLATEWQQGPGTLDPCIEREVVMCRDGYISERIVQRQARRALTGEGK